MWHRSEPLETVKTVVQNYRPEPELLDLFERFRRMVNLSITIGLDSGKSSLKSLSLVGYSRLKVFGTTSHYRLCAISRAAGILKNYRNLSRKHKVRSPYCRRPGVTMCYGLRVRDGALLLPGGFSTPLNDYVLGVLEKPYLRILSVALTEFRICISFSKETPTLDSTGMLGIDRNLDNVTAVDSRGNIIVSDLSPVTRIQSSCRKTIAGFKRPDNRIRRKIAGKYGRIEKDRTQWLLHNASRKLVNHAKAQRLSIVLENIKGIRRLYLKGNSQSRSQRGRLNSWPFHELDRQVSYKASWEGIRVVHVNPKGTSSKCSRCGDRVVFSKQSRMLRCPSCGYHADRDVNAARNILSAGLRFSLWGLSGEAVKRNPTPTVIPKVDDSQSSPRAHF